MTCNIVGENEQQPGETPVDHYRRLERRRNHWRQLLVGTLPSAVADTYRFYLDNCQEKLDDLAVRSAVTFWTEINGDRVRGKAVPLLRYLSSPDCADLPLVRGNQAFATDRAFQIWARDHGGSHTDRAVYALSKHPDLRACVARRGEGATVRVPTHEEHAPCEKGWLIDTRISLPTGYRLHVRDGAIVVDHKISFHYTGSAKNREAVLARVRESKRCVERFYADHGLKLELTFHMDPAFPEFYKQSDILVRVDDRQARAFTDEWHFPVSEDDMPNDRLCGIAAHEIGHQLGLPDLYPEHDRCPDQRAGDDPANLMYAGSWTIGSARLSPEQVRKIVAPLCGP